MLIQRGTEKRSMFLARVLLEFITTTSAGSETVEYDGTACDGFCLAEEIIEELGYDVSDLQEI